MGRRIRTYLANFSRYLLYPPIPLAFGFLLCALAPLRSFPFAVDAEVRVGRDAGTVDLGRALRLRDRNLLGICNLNERSPPIRDAGGVGPHVLDLATHPNPTVVEAGYRVDLEAG